MSVQSVSASGLSAAGDVHPYMCALNMSSPLITSNMLFLLSGISEDVSFHLHFLFNAQYGFAEWK